eukprot:gene21565-27603_t
MIFLSIRQCDSWSKAYHLNLSELLDGYFNKEEKSWKYRIMPTALSNVISQMEFRIFHNIFCEAYSMQREAFAFERFVFTIVRIRPINWLCLILLMYLDYARVSNKLYFHTCEEHDVHCIEKSSIVVYCFVGALVYGITLIFIVVSRYYQVRIIRQKGIQGLDFYPTYLLYMEADSPEEHQTSRLNEDELKATVAELRKGQGADNGQHKPLIKTFKKKRNNSLTSAIQGDVIRANRSNSSLSDVGSVVSVQRDEVLSRVATLMSIADMSSSKSYQGVSTSQSVDSRQQAFIDLNSMSSGGIAFGLNSQSAPAPEEQDYYSMKQRSADEEEEEGGEIKFAESRATKLTHNTLPPMHSTPNKSASGSQKEHSPVRRDSSGDSAKYLAMGRRSPSPGLDIEMGEVSVAQQDSNADLIREEMVRYESCALPANEAQISLECETSLTAENNEVLNSFKRKKQSNIDDVFLFSSHCFYLESVKLLIMLIALNLAYWLVYFVGSASPLEWKVLAFLPPALSFFNYVYIVKTAALIKAVVALDETALVEVLEQTEAAQDLTVSIREQLVAKLTEMVAKEKRDRAGALIGDERGVSRGGMTPEDKLGELYDVMDVNKDNTLTRQEFTVFLHKLHIYPTRKKWRQIFRVIDRNADNDISKDELKLFVFPNDQRAQAAERRRLREIRQRVVIKTLELTERMRKQGQVKR